MNGLTISRAAAETGFSPSALRYYERSGLVQPERTEAGYRRYDADDLAALRFIGRAKGFGLRLDEITDLLGLLDDDRCAPVQGRLRSLVDAKVADAERQIADLVAFTAELQHVSASLGTHTPDGPCDDDCGCTTAPTPAAASSVAAMKSPDGSTASASLRTAVPLAVGPAAEDGSARIACTLSSDQVGPRVADWQRVLGVATSRRAVDGGVRVGFDRGVDVAEVARLAAAEQDCCRFFTFRLTINGQGSSLDITGPPDAAPVIAALAGLPSHPNR